MRPWLRERITLLKNWAATAKRAAEIIRRIEPSAQIYVFGSVVEGQITGASDIDLLIILPDDHDPLRAHLEISLALAREYGEHAAIFDLHVITRRQASYPPYAWWLCRAVNIDSLPPRRSGTDLMVTPR